MLFHAVWGRPCCWRWMLLHCASLSWTYYSCDSVTSPPSSEQGFLNSIEWLKVAIRCDFKLAWIPAMKSRCCTYSGMCCEITCCLGTRVTWCLKAGFAKVFEHRNSSRNVYYLYFPLCNYVARILRQINHYILSSNFAEEILMFYYFWRDLVFVSSLVFLIWTACEWNSLNGVTRSLLILFFFFVILYSMHISQPFKGMCENIFSAYWGSWWLRDLEKNCPHVWPCDTCCHCHWAWWLHPFHLRDSMICFTGVWNMQVLQNTWLPFFSPVSNYYYHESW